MTTLPSALAKHPELDMWIRVDAQETVTVFTGKVELGQGLVSAIARIGAEELDLSLQRVRVATADTAHGLNELYTAGSQSMADSGSAIRQAAAEARAHLLELAAAQLGVPASELRVNDGVVTASAGTAKTSYWQLLGGKQFNLRVNGRARPKRSDEYGIVGKAGPRVDVAGLVTGTTLFVQDLQRPGMLHGRVVRPPSPAARLESLDDAPVWKLPGVVAVVRDGDFLGVVAGREEEAVRAREMLRARARWQEQESLPEARELHDWLLNQPVRSFLIMDGAPIEAPIETPAPPDDALHTTEATYTRPYQLHGAVGPSAALAEWHEGALRVWTHAQGPFPLRDALAEALGVDASAVRVIHVVGPGCYGHNGADDAALDAALLAQAVPGRSVLLKWMRDDEHAWEPFGPPAAVKIRASLDEHGRLLDWNLDHWGTTHSSRASSEREGSALLAAWHRAVPLPRTQAAPLLLREAGIHRNATPAYRVPRRRIVKHFVENTPLRSSALRALGAYANVFAIESMMDELAELAETDPVEFRLTQLDDDRARAVIVAAAEHADWRCRTREDGRGMGIGFARYKNAACYAAVVVELVVDDATAEIRLQRAVIAADAGQVIDPTGLANQLEGGLIQSASWTLKEQVSFDRTRVTTVDWESYPLLTFPEVPQIETVILDRPGEPYLGSGEATQGPTAGAIANAVYDAVGLRLHDIPFTPERVRAAAAAVN